MSGFLEPLCRTDWSTPSKSVTEEDEKEEEEDGEKRCEDLFPGSIAGCTVHSARFGHLANCNICSTSTILLLLLLRIPLSQQLLIYDNGLQFFSRPPQGTRFMGLCLKPPVIYDHIFIVTASGKNGLKKRREDGKMAGKKGAKQLLTIRSHKRLDDVRRAGVFKPWSNR